MSVMGFQKKLDVLVNSIEVYLGLLTFFKLCNTPAGK